MTTIRQSKIRLRWAGATFSLAALCFFLASIGHDSPASLLVAGSLNLVAGIVCIVKHRAMTA